MNIRATISFAILLLPLYGCNENFLALAPQTERNVLYFYKTQADFDNAVLGNYNALRLTGVNTSLIWMGEVSTDNSDYGIWRQAGNFDNYQFIDFTYTTLNSIIYAAWRDHYIGISRANAILTRIENSDINEDAKKRFRGEAQFLRAYFYFNLVRLFGSVPLVTEEITNPDAANNLTRTPEGDIYKVIIADLQSAEKSLPLNYGSAEIGRATSGAAQSLLGKVYLTLRDWNSAASKLKEVIDGGRYKILSRYSDVFAYDKPVNDEIIFNVQYKSGNTGQGSDFWQRFVPQGAGTVLGPNGGLGEGMNRPRPDLVDGYEPGDLRKAFSVQTSYQAADGSTVNEPFVTKFKQFGALKGDSDVDWPILRYADVILMYAEALHEGGHTVEAVPYVNTIRKRAGLPNVSPSEQTDLSAAILKERRFEFAFESQRWFDLIRAGKYITTLKGKGMDVKDFNTLFLIPQRERDLNKALTQNPGY